MWKKIISREYGVQYTEISLKSLSPKYKFIVPRPFYEQIYVPENGNQVCFIDERKWNSLVKALKKKYLGKVENYGKFEKLFIKTGKEYVEISKKIASENLTQKNNKELKKLYLTYQKIVCQYTSYVWIQFILNNLFADKVKEIITKKFGKRNKKALNFYEIALKPDKKAAVLQLVDIAPKWKKMNSKEKIDIYKKFKWIPCLDIHNKPWTKKEFFSHIKEFQKPEKRVSISYNFLLEKINPSKKEKQILEAAKRLSYLKDLKDDFRRQGVFYAQNFFKEIAKRMGLKLNEISYLLESEIKDFLDKGNVISKKIIQERKKGFVIFFAKNKRIICRSGDEIIPTLKKLKLTIFEEKLIKEIKGIPASSGRAKGIVTIVKGIDDLIKMKKEHILVAVTTHPDYLPAMQKALAIITDEGGSTCHAAIVSRELGIPCVVGTKIATKVLKDGNLVEVDADKGIVKILK